MRKLLLALFATAAAVPTIVSAQEPERDRLRFERSDDSPRAERPRRQDDEPRFQAGDDARRNDRPAREERPAAPAAAEARPDRGSSDNREWTRRRADPAPAQIQVQADARRRSPDWNSSAPRLGDPGTRSARPDWNRNDAGRRDWQRDDNTRRDWNRDGSAGRDWNRNTGRDWNRDRNNDGRRDWNRNDNRSDWSRNGRNDWNDRRDWNGNGGWNGNNRDFRQWDRGWRNNNRYDWQRYRSSNRYVFRLPRYAAPYDWQYGYRRQSIGAYLFAGLFARDYWIDDPWEYRLPPVYWPYQWVRYYNDALLVDTRSGYVVDVIPDIFWY